MAKRKLKTKKTEETKVTGKPLTQQEIDANSKKAVESTQRVVVIEPEQVFKEPEKVQETSSEPEKKRAWCSVCQRGNDLTEDDKCSGCGTLISWCRKCQKIKCFNEDNRCMDCGGFLK